MPDSFCDDLIFLPLFAGNHESLTLNQMYGFEGEVKSKYTSQMADLFTEVYNHLPLAHCINKQIMVSILHPSQKYDNYIRVSIRS